MCILILRVVVAKILSVASSLHARRERVGGIRDCRRAGVRGGGSRIGRSPIATDG